MSSILDALKKVEEEKKAREAAELATRDSFHPEAATADLTGEAPGGGGGAIRVLGATVAMMSLLRPQSGGGTVVASHEVAVPADVGGSVAETGTAPRATTAVIEAAAVGEFPVAVVEVVVPESDSAVGDDSVPPLNEARELAAQVVSDVAAEARDGEVVRVAAVVPRATRPLVPAEREVLEVPESPEHVLVPKRTSRASTTPSAVSSAPSPRARSVVPKDIRDLPPLRSAERARFGLESLKINMLREPSKNRPRGSVIINLKKVYLDERIPGTSARLVGVVSHGIALEVGSERELYFLAN
jgi:hypothetical protein